MKYQASFPSFSMDRDETGLIAAREMMHIEMLIEDLKEAAGRATDGKMDSSDASTYLLPFTLAM